MCYNEPINYRVTIMSIAKTILQQLGGNRFVAMTGAKNLADTGKGLSMKIMRNACKVTHVTIELTPLDLYLVKFIKVRGTNMTVISEHDMVYAEDLRQLFETNTGLYTYL